MGGTRQVRLLLLALLGALACLSGAGPAAATDGVDPCIAAGGSPGHEAPKYLLTCTFDAPGSYSFEVPAGTRTVAVTAIGGKGGRDAAAAGGNGAQASATFKKLGGATLTVVVGGAGGATGDSGNGGYPDGGAGGDNPATGSGGAGGGGSSSVVAPTGPLVIAGGGGGAGDQSPSQLGLTPGFGANAGVGMNGGTGQGGGDTAGASGGSGGSDPRALTPGTSGVPGSGGVAFGECTAQGPGADGTGTGGGSAPDTFGGAGGGGGGGYGAGGGGGAGAYCDSIFAAGGGGGGGSSLVGPKATAPQILQNTEAPGTGTGFVVITYRLPPAKNLVTDGGFEDPPVTGKNTIAEPGTIGPWSVSGSATLVADDYWQAAEGHQSVDVAGAGLGGVGSTFSAPYADTYRVSFDLAANPDCGPGRRQLGVLWNGILVASPFINSKGHTRASMGWKSRSVEVFDMPGQVSLQFVALTGGACGPVVDKIAVTYL